MMSNNTSFNNSNMQRGGGPTSNSGPGSNSYDFPGSGSNNQGSNDYNSPGGPLSHLSESVNSLDPLNAMEKSLSEQVSIHPLNCYLK